MAQNWAIAVGINKYSNLQHLNYAKFDAMAMRDWLEREGKFDRVFLFTDDSPEIPASPPISTQPTYGNLRRFLRVNFEQSLLKPGDNLWFFFSGHGRREAEKDYLMLADSDPGEVEHSAISVNYVTERLRRSGADNVVLFLDACRDEGTKSGLGIGEEKHQGVITFYSCRAKEKAYEIEDLEQGSFTYNLLSALRIQGEGNCATVERLERYLSLQVPQLNRKYGKNPQNPYAMTEPATKLHLILLPQYATLQDIAALKNDAYRAEVGRNWELARQLWIRVNISARGYDEDAIEAFVRIATQQQQSFSSSTPEPSISSGARTSNPVSSPKIASKTTPPVSTAPLVFQFEVVTVNDQGKEVNRKKGQAEYIVSDLGNGVGLEMVSIPGDKFLMGSPEGTKDADEKPQHEVTVQPFFIGKYQVTQAQWKIVAGFPKVNRDLESDPSNFKGDNRPIETISWDEAVEFCARLSKRLGSEYRLPSEAEWEYACRAGTTTPFHFGDTITTDLVNYNGNYTFAKSPKGKYRNETTPVGTFPPNAFGLYDIHGNVWEWCADTWHGNYQGAPNNETSWINENDNQYRVLRGGSWGSTPDICRSANRRRYTPDFRNYFVGFRVVLGGVARTLH